VSALWCVSGQVQAGHRDARGIRDAMGTMDPSAARTSRVGGRRRAGRWSAPELRAYSERPKVSTRRPPVLDC